MAALDDLGLQTALAHYIEAWSERSGVAVEYQSTIPDTERLRTAIAELTASGTAGPRGPR